jgi:hypothetical protein
MKAKYSYVLTTWPTGNMNPVDEAKGVPIVMIPLFLHSHRILPLTPKVPHPPSSSTSSPGNQGSIPNTSACSSIVDSSSNGSSSAIDTGSGSSNGSSSAINSLVKRVNKISCRQSSSSRSSSGTY